MTSRLDKWFREEQKKYGSARYFFKEECLSSKIIAFYVRPFNPTYLYRYTTMRYPHTYYPGRKKGDEEGMLSAEFHENVHKWDRWKRGIWFSLKYAYPQILAVPFILAAVLLSGPWGWAGFGAFLALFHAGLGVLAASAGNGDPADGYAAAYPSRRAVSGFYVLAGLGGAACIAGSVIGGGLLALLWLGAALFISPWPLRAVYRRDAEIRGYTATLYWMWLKHRDSWDEKLADRALERIVRNFTGPAYFFMERDGDYVEAELRSQLIRMWCSEDAFLITWKTHWGSWRGDRVQAEPFRMISRFVRREKMV